jgi:hypothetical protein
MADDTNKPDETKAADKAVDDSTRDAGDKGEARIPKQRLDAEIEKTKAERAARETAERELETLRADKAKREEDEKKAADAKALEEGKLKELLDTRDGDLKKAKDAHATVKTQLEETTKLVDSLTAHVNGQINADIATWPEDVKAGDPGEERLADRMAWAEKVRTARAAAADTDTEKDKAKQKTNGTGGKPPIVANATETDAAREAQASMRADVRRSF